MMDVSNAFPHLASILTPETFRLNETLIALGSSLVVPLGVTSARWQVRDAVAEACGALP